MLHKKKKILFFISKKIQLIQRSYNQQCHSLQLGSEQYKHLPQKKKNLKKGKGKEKKRECEREGKGEERGERERIEEKRGKNGESGIKSFFFLVPPPPPPPPPPLQMHSLAQLRHRTQLGNNITPTREKLGKNTTPTSRRPSEPNVSSRSPGRPPAMTTKP